LLLFALIASFCPFFGTLGLLDSAEISVAPILIVNSGVEILAKIEQNGKKKQIFITGLNLALVLLLVQT
jgi:hypothetical protein